MADVTSISNSSVVQIKGATNKLGVSGTPSQIQKFSVSQAGEFNFKIEDSFTSVQIYNSRNEEVANLSSNADMAQAQAKLGAGTYTAVISQKMKTTKGREYTLDISPHQNALVTAGGGNISGNARPLVGKDTGVEKHSLNVIQGGNFAFNMSLPGTRWAVMDKDGKLVASGDTLSTDRSQLDVLNKSVKLDPGNYDVTVILPSKLASQQPWRLDLIPKLADAPAADPQANMTGVQKILAARDERLKEWAAEDAAKSSK